MIYILLSILLSSFLVISFKIFDRLKIKSSQAIVFNYFTASACGIVLSYHEFSKFEFIYTDWFPYIVLMGLLFISVFNIIAISVTRVGITPVSIAQKMSLIIPVAFSIYYYHEKLGLIKIAGIALALIAIWFTSKKDQSSDLSPQSSLVRWAFPLIIFIGSGIVDVGIKLVESYYSKQADMNLVLTCIFGSAGIIGVITLLFRKEKIELKNILGGLCLGFVNYSATYFLIKALSNKDIESSVIFPVNNIGVIIFSTFVALFFFKEKINSLNWAGIAISILSILLISFS
jgi:drug/metabolite transporter (DMT)-like permease